MVARISAPCGLWFVGAVYLVGTLTGKAYSEPKAFIWQGLFISVIYGRRVKTTKINLIALVIFIFLIVLP